MQKNLPPSISRTTTPIPTNKSCTGSEISNSTHSTHTHVIDERPFVQDDISNNSYPSVLALKLSFTNQASNDAVQMMQPSYVQTSETTTLNTQNGEQNDYDEDNNGFYGNGATAKQQKQQQRSKQNNSHFLSPSAANKKYSTASSMYDYADKFDPPHTATPSPRHRIKYPSNNNIVLQSVIEDLSEETNNNNNNNKSANRKRKQLQSEKVKNKLYKQHRHHRQKNGSQMSMELNININNNQSPKKRKARYNKMQHSSSVVIVANKRAHRNLRIRRPLTPKTRASSPSSSVTYNQFRPRRHRSYNSKEEMDPDMLSNDSLMSTDSETSLSTNTLSDKNNMNPMLRSSTVNTPLAHTHHHHYHRNHAHHQRRYKPKNHQRPVPIIRRPITNVTKNGSTKRPKRYGLFDKIHEYKHNDKQPSMLTEWTLSELRDHFYSNKESKKYRSYAESELSMNYEAMKSLSDALCVSHNGDHHLCKQAIQDAFEKGFYTGMFLGSHQ